jgi:hypothetical protein
LAKEVDDCLFGALCPISLKEVVVVAEEDLERPICSVFEQCHLLTQKPARAQPKSLLEVDRTSPRG